MAKVVIIGAGLTGLSAAYHLEQNAFFDYALFEKEASVGGLCRSVEHEGFTFDYTGHLIHTSNDYFKNFLSDIGLLEHCNYIQRNAMVYSHGAYTSYPFQTNLHGLPPSVIVECIEGFLKRKKTIRAPQNLHQWIEKYFGRGIGKHFLFPYNEKILSYDIKQVHHSWTGRFVPATSLQSIVEGAIHNRKKDGAGYNSYFYYPKQGGIATFPRLIEAQLKKNIHYTYAVSSIDMKNKIVHFSNGHQEQFEQLITTMPLSNLLSSMHEGSSTLFSSALPHLVCNSVININLGIKKPELHDMHWIYFPEKKFPFYRVGCWTNFTKAAAPPDHCSLYGEFSYLPTHTKQSLVNKKIEKSIAVMSSLFSFTNNDIATIKILTLPHAYVIYTLWREKYLTTLLGELKTQNIISTGRFGAWKYSSMQEAILDGRTAASEIINNQYSRNSHVMVSQ